MKREHDPEDEQEDDDPEDLDQKFTDLGAAQRSEPDWVVKNLVPVGLSVWGAPPKSGKSTLTMVAAALVADLKPRVLPPDLCEVPEPGRVKVFSYEATDGELKVMLEDGIHVKVPADGRILVCSDPWAFRLDDEDLLNELLDILTRTRPRLVIMDPFRDMHDLEEKDSGSMIRLLRPLREWAVKYRAGIIMVHHTTKVSEETTSYEAKHLRGSGAIFGKADAVVMLTPQVDGKTQISAVFKRAKSWLRTLQLSLYDVKTTSEPLTDRDILVLRGLKAKASYDEIAKQLHISKSAVSGHLNKLLRNEYLKRVGKKLVITKKEIVR